MRRARTLLSQSPNPTLINCIVFLFVRHPHCQGEAAGLDTSFVSPVMARGKGHHKWVSTLYFIVGLVLISGYD